MSRFFIERPILANVIAIVMLLIGGVCLSQMPVAQYPQIVPPTIQVSTIYFGADAQTVADTIAIPIERAVNGVENSIYMQSTSGSDGSYTLTITFSIGSDLNKALSLVQNAVSSATPQLPPSIAAQGVNVRKVSTNILLIESLYSKDDRYDEVFLSNYAGINLVSPLQRLPGVGQVSVLGAGPYAMRVWLDASKMQAFGVTPAQVQYAIASQSNQMVGGQIGGPPTADGQLYQFTVTALGRLTEVRQFENIIVKSVPPPSQPSASTTSAQTAALVRLKDVARVELSQQSYTVFSGLSGKKAAHVAIYSLPGANALEVADIARAKMKELSKVFPPGLEYTSLYDTTMFIQESIGAVYTTLIEAGLLVLAVIMLFLQNPRAMLVPAVSIPVTIVGSFAAMAALGFTVNLMTLFALILAIGIVVDDAIVIVENTSRYIEKGLSPKEAAIKAMGELTGPILGITLVLTSVFLPASFLPGITGQMFRQFALVIAATAILSAISALTLQPAQCALYLKARPAGFRENWFYRGFNRAFAAFENVYLRLVTWMTQRPKRMASLFFGVVGAAAVAFSVYPTSLMPLEDQGYCILIARLPAGSSQARVRETAAAVDAVLGEEKAVKGWVSIGGFSALDAAKVSNVLTTFVVLNDFDKRPKDFSLVEYLGELNKRFTQVPQASFVVMPPSPIPGLGTAFGFQMMIEDRGNLGTRELQTATNALLDQAREEPDLLRMGFTTFDANSPKISVDIDRTAARSLGVPVKEVLSAVQTYLGSSYVNTFNQFNQSFQVRLQGEAEFRRRIEDIRKLNVMNTSGQMVPLGSLAQVVPASGSDLIYRYNLYPAAALIGIPTPKYSSGEAMDKMADLSKEALPPGVSYEWTGLAYQEKLMGNQSALLFGLSIVLVFLILAGQYESWLDPAAVILTVPMSLVGIVLALVVRKYPVDIYTQIGLVLMIALAAKNAILIVEFARELQTEGMSSAQAAVEATRRRLRPIIMTSLAFILGVVPLLQADGAGSASQRALGTVVFGGMLASTLFAIPFVPVFYILMHQIGDRLRSGGRIVLPEALRRRRG